MTTQAIHTRHTLTILTYLIIVLAAIASFGGLFWKNLYHDTAIIKMAWFGNDLVTFFLVVPLLILAIRWVQNGSSRACLGCLGLLAYVFYNYAFYLFGAAYNKFFLLYVALFSLSLFALVIGFIKINAGTIQKHFHPLIPVKWISLFLIFISLPLGVVEAGQCLQYIISDKAPEVPPLIFALDLSIVVPNTALAAVLLWRRHPWGYVLAVIMLIKAFTYGLVLSLSTTLIAGISKLGPWDPFLPFYLFVAAGGFLGSLVLLGSIKRQMPKTH